MTFIQSFQASERTVQTSQDEVHLDWQILLIDEFLFSYQNTVTFSFSKYCLPLFFKCGIFSGYFLVKAKAAYYNCHAVSPLSVMVVFSYTVELTV